MINVEERTNHVLNIVKAKYGLRDKSLAIDRVVNEYEERLPELRHGHKDKVLKIVKEKHLSEGKNRVTVLN